MPNIELHGYGDTSEVMRRSIAGFLTGQYQHADETVITVFTSTVTTLKGKSSPYLRVIALPSAIGDLVKLLESLGEDIEVMPLGQWIPYEYAAEVRLREKEGSGVGAHIPFEDENDLYIGNLTFHEGKDWQITDSANMTKQNMGAYYRALVLARVKYPQG